MRPVYLIGKPILSDAAMMRLRTADRLHGAPIVIVDGCYHEVTAATAASRPARALVTDPTYAARAKAAAEAKRARKAARRSAQAGGAA